MRELNDGNRERGLKTTTRVGRKSNEAKLVGSRDRRSRQSEQGQRRRDETKRTEKRDREKLGHRLINSRCREEQVNDIKRQTRESDYEGGQQRERALTEKE